MLTKTPALTRSNDGHWVLSQSIKDGLVKLLINYEQENTSYYIHLYRAGICTELLSREQYVDGITNAFEMHGEDGDAAFREKFAPRDRSETISEAYATGKALIKHWEAMLALGLFSPEPTLV